MNRARPRVVMHMRDWTRWLALASLLCDLFSRPLVEFRLYTHRNAAFSTLHLPAVTLVGRDDAEHLK